MARPVPEDQSNAIRDQLKEYEERKVGLIYIVPVHGNRVNKSFLLMVVQKKWFLDIEKTPCARDALVHGILGGVALGLLYFAKSSNRMYLHL